ncbi:hypothetical protein [Nostoc sp. EfeVER01]|uniref:hypothetical protein n=1 Tax=Nostoc sp. EfeVER01 TaxID=3075406 RepID=UPI002ADB2300|nr:hypothetical protein [Nostoc sp. EfeVER01]
MNFSLLRFGKGLRGLGFALVFRRLIKIIWIYAERSQFPPQHAHSRYNHEPRLVIPRDMCNQSPLFEKNQVLSVGFFQHKLGFLTEKERC